MPDEIENKIDKVVRPEIEKIIDYTYDTEIAEEIKSSIQYWTGEDKRRSALMYENIASNDEYPNGRILLHVDACLACGRALGNSPAAYLSYNLFQAITLWFRFRGRGYNYTPKEDDRNRAVSTAKRYCKKLYNKGIVNDLPKDIHSDHESAMSYALWIKEWTGMDLGEYVNYVQSNWS